MSIQAAALCNSTRSKHFIGGTNRVQPLANSPDAAAWSGRAAACEGGKRRFQSIAGACFQELHGALEIFDCPRGARSPSRPRQTGVWFCVGFFTGAGWAGRRVARRTGPVSHLNANAEKFVLHLKSYRCAGIACTAWNTNCSDTGEQLRIKPPLAEAIATPADRILPSLALGCAWRAPRRTSSGPSGFRRHSRAVHRRAGG